MTIRPARRDEASELARVVRAAFRTVAERFHLTEENFAGQSPYCTAEMILADMAEGQIYHVLECEGAICGCVATAFKQPDVLHARRFGVLPDKRGAGLGLALAEHVIAIGRQLECACVQCGVIADNVELIAWYQRLGFTITERCRFDHLPFEVIRMSLDLTIPLRG